MLRLEKPRRKIQARSELVPIGDKSFQVQVRAPVEKSLKERPDRPAAPEQKSGNRRSSAKMGRGRRDERRGTVRAGAASGVCGGDEPAGSGAAVWDRPANGSENAGVLGAAGIPAEPATGAAEAGSVRRYHRPDPGGR